MLLQHGRGTRASKPSHARKQVVLQAYAGSTLANIPLAKESDMTKRSIREREELQSCRILKKPLIGVIKSISILVRTPQSDRKPIDMFLGHIYPRRKKSPNYNYCVLGLCYGHAQG